MIQPTPPERLLAKSTKGGMDDTPTAPQMLQGHTMLVTASARALAALRGRAALMAVGLPHDALKVEELTRIVVAAALIHDLGKCSHQFQSMLRKKGIHQGIRHEALTAWLCWPGQPLASWLAQGQEDAILMTVVAVAAGHHRKFWQKAVDLEAPTPVVLWTNHPDFAQLLTQIGKELTLGPAPSFSLPHSIDVTERTNPTKLFSNWGEDLQDLLRQDISLRKLVGIGKALLISADVAGSALPKEEPGMAPRAWIEAQLSHRATPEQWNGVVKKRLGEDPLREFQKMVGASTAPVTLVRGGCGSGKTLAAYHWAASQAGDRQLWVTYPTTGTATEGFRDYVMDSDVTAVLDHSRREVDLEILGLADGSDGVRDAHRMEALQNWGKHAITCTADTVLGLVQNQRKGLYAFPGLAHSAVVFDEIHSYDGKLFGCLLEFLRQLPGIPVLLMTASLPEHRRVLLNNLCKDVHECPLAEITGPKDLEELPRYHQAAETDPTAAALAALRQEKKVLWVSNTVNRVLSLGAQAWPVRPHVYHSRFKYADRVGAHDRVLQGFAQPGAVLALTTQVAEMSLDLSADLLITDLAPIPALIQRLGRLNRWSTKKKPDPVAHFLVLEVEKPAPYTSQELTDAREWLKNLGKLDHVDLSQEDLAKTWKPDPAALEEPVHNPWMAGGLLTETHTCRDASPGITVLLEQDAPAVAKKHKLAQRLSIPMSPPPKCLNWREWPRTAHLPVAPASAISYDWLMGAAWLK